MASPQSRYVTLDRFLVEQQRKYPEASGRFTRFMGQIGTVAKIISNHMSRAALDGLLGTTGEENVQGEQGQATRRTRQPRVRRGVRVRGHRGDARLRGDE